MWIWLKLRESLGGLRVLVVHFSWSEMAKDLAIVLNNGSINSAVATALAVQPDRR